MQNNIVIGRITKDIELRTTEKGINIVKLNIAVNNGKEDITFFPITLFNKTAELVNQYCRKGDLIGINYIVKNHNWEDEKGNKHYDYTFIGNNIHFLAKNNKNEYKVSQEQESVSNEVKNENTDNIWEEFSNENEEELENLPF